MRIVVTVVLVLVTGVLLGTIGSIAWETYTFAERLRAQILPGARINDVDVGQMTRDEALAAVLAEVDPVLDRPIEVRGPAGHTYRTSPRELGSSSDAEAVVDEAFTASRTVPWLGLVRMRWLGERLEFDEWVAIRHDEEAARAFVERVAAGVNRQPVDAKMDTSRGRVDVTPEQAGLVVDTDATGAALAEEVRGPAGAPGVVELEVRQIAPAVTAASFGKVLLVRVGENKLYLYDGGKITHEWLVTTGLPGYPTPTGRFSIGAKRFMPTWVNPAPDGWGKGMPASIGPGPGNPLGVRALNWIDEQGRDTGIRFHGTQAVSQLGRPGSHGCVRLSNDAVVVLYDLVDVGTPIISVA